MPGSGMAIEVHSGSELDRLVPSSGALDVRWWFFAHVTGEDGRPQRPRQGVHDEGFCFARGGRVATHAEADAQIAAAAREAELELSYWRSQPSHMLAPNGALVPIGEVAGHLGA